MNSASLKKYLRPRTSWIKRALAHIIFWPCVGICYLCRVPVWNILGYVVVLLGLPAFLIAWKTGLLKSFLRKLNRQDAMYTDLAQATYLFNGKLLLGREWIAGKGAGRAVAAADLREVSLAEKVHLSGRTELLVKARVLPPEKAGRKKDPASQEAGPGISEKLFDAFFGTMILCRMRPHEYTDEDMRLLRQTIDAANARRGSVTS